MSTTYNLLHGEERRLTGEGYDARRWSEGTFVLCGRCAKCGDVMRDQNIGEIYRDIEDMGRKVKKLWDDLKS